MAGGVATAGHAYSGPHSLSFLDKEREMQIRKEQDVDGGVGGVGDSATGVLRSHRRGLGGRAGRSRVKGSRREGGLAAAAGLEPKVLVRREEIRALPFSVLLAGPRERGGRGGPSWRMVIGLAPRAQRET